MADFTSSLDQDKYVCAILVGSLRKLEIGTTRNHYHNGFCAKRLSCCLMNTGSHLLSMGFIQKTLCIFSMNAKYCPIGQGRDCDVTPPPLHFVHIENALHFLRKCQVYPEWLPCQKFIFSQCSLADLRQGPGSWRQSL